MELRADARVVPLSGVAVQRERRERRRPDKRGRTTCLHGSCGRGVTGALTGPVTADSAGPRPWRHATPRKARGNSSPMNFPLRQSVRRPVADPLPKLCNARLSDARLFRATLLRWIAAGPVGYHWSAMLSAVSALRSCSRDCRKRWINRSGSAAIAVMLALMAVAWVAAKFTGRVQTPA